MDKFLGKLNKQLTKDSHTSKWLVIGFFISLLGSLLALIFKQKKSSKFAAMLTWGFFERWRSLQTRNQVAKLIKNEKLGVESDDKR